jgi:hypothetical protein
MELIVELLARDLGREHPVGRVGNLVLREVPRALRGTRAASHCLRSPTPSPLAAETMKISSNESRSDRTRGERQQHFLADEIDLVQDQDLRLAPLGKSDRASPRFASKGRFRHRRRAR